MKKISMNINYKLSSVEEVYELTEEMKTVLVKRLVEDDTEYLAADQSINLLNAKYGYSSNQKSFNTNK
jgi:hypothetical protein